MGTSRKKHSAAFKAQVAVAALQERESFAELSKRFEVSPAMISKWKQNFLSRSSTVFEKPAPKDDFDKEKERLYAKIGQLVGSFAGRDKEYRYSTQMKYGDTGNILRKTQSNEFRKYEGDWSTVDESSMDYSYSYDGQKPHAVSSIVDANTETLFTYTYDASGNNLIETNSKASSDRQIVWTEDNRIAAIKARGNVSHYIYDANGIRTLKMNSSSFNISVNGVTAGSTTIDGNFTVYANPYTVVRQNQCTKHFFLGSQRILTKISSADVSKTFYEGNARDEVGNVDYTGKQSSLEENMDINTEKLNIGWYRNTHGEVPSE